jgi:hypothetical protein
MNKLAVFILATSLLSISASAIKLQNLSGEKVVISYISYSFISGDKEGALGNKRKLLKIMDSQNKEEIDINFENILQGLKNKLTAENNTGDVTFFANEIQCNGKIHLKYALGGPYVAKIQNDTTSVTVTKSGPDDKISCKVSFGN